MTLLHVTSTGPVFVRGADDRRFPVGPGETHDLPADLNQRAIDTGALTPVDEKPKPSAESPEDPAATTEPEEPQEDSTATPEPDAPTTETTDPDDAEHTTSATTTKSSKPRTPRKEQ